jgi:uncharacterized repeat protein (TIGR01451 family)
MKDTFMNFGIQKFLGVATLLALGVSAQAFAAEQGCIVLKSTAEVEQEVVGANGEKSKKLVAADKVVPGVEVVWTVTANNVCKQPSDKVTINNAVPAHMTYVANSATGPGADITYSLDGQNFGPAEQLSVSESGGKRKARADEYKNIRWVFKNSLQPGSQAVAQFRAVLN